THQAIRAFFRPGTRTAFHASGIGKAVLSHLDGERVAAITAKAGLEAFTEKTLSTLPALVQDLAAIKARGWSVDDEERNLACAAWPPPSSTNSASRSAAFPSRARRSGSRR